MGVIQERSRSTDIRNQTKNPVADITKIHHNAPMKRRPVHTAAEVSLFALVAGRCSSMLR